MGLDMYIYTNSKQTCEDALRAMEDDGSEYAAKTKEFYRTRGIAMYWRKQNAIHQWFVDHVQDGIDDCKEYPVYPEQLVELRDTCKKVLAARRRASELLPTQSGFFFGSTDYDDWYFEGLEYTARAIQLMLEHVKEVDAGWSFEHEKDPGWMVRFTYRSSW